MFIRIILFLIFSLILVSCANKKVLTSNRYTDSKLSLNKIAGTKFYDNYKIDYNATQEYAIVLKRRVEISAPITDIKYFVFSIKKKEVIIEDSLKAGNVFWQNKYDLKAFSRDKKAESSEQSYIFNVKAKEYSFE